MFTNYSANVFVPRMSKEENPPENTPKINKFIWTSVSEQFPLGSWLVSHGRKQKFARIFRKSSCKRAFFLVFWDLEWVFGPLQWGSLATPPRQKITRGLRKMVQGKTAWVDSPCADCPGFLVPGAADAPPPGRHPGASECAPGLAFAPWPLRANSWICCPQLPCKPCKNGTHSTCFCLQHRGRGRKNPKKSRKWQFFKFFSGFRLVFNSFSIFLSFFDPRAERPREPLFRFFSEFSTERPFWPP